MTRNALIGIVMMIVAMQVVPINDALAKVMSQSLPVLLVVFMRTFAQSIFLTLFNGIVRRWPRPRVIWRRQHALRGFLWWIATVLFFYAIRDHDIPGALALFFTGPVFVACAAPLVLKERFDIRFFLAALGGFVGAIIILQPTAGELQLGLLPALLSGVCYGSYLMATRHAALDKELAAGEIAFGAGFWASVCGLPFALFVWQSPTAELWLLIAVMGICSACGHIFIALACQRTAASKLAPYTYTEMVGALIASYFIFGTVPPLSVGFGIALIVVSGAWAAVAARQRPVDAIV